MTAVVFPHEKISCEIAITACKANQLFKNQLILWINLLQMLPDILFNTCEILYHGIVQFHNFFRFSMNQRISDTKYRCYVHKMIGPCWWHLIQLKPARKFGILSIWEYLFLEKLTKRIEDERLMCSWTRLPQLWL